MSRALPELRELARRLVEWASDESRTTSRVEAAERVLQALAARLRLLVGAAGFNMMMMRALKLAADEHPILRGVPPQEDGGKLLSDLEEAEREGRSGEVSSAVEAVIAELIGLLARLLGADMTVRLVRESLPDVPLGSAESGAEEIHNE